MPSMTKNAITIPLRTRPTQTDFGAEVSLAAVSYFTAVFILSSFGGTFSCELRTASDTRNVVSALSEPRNSQVGASGRALGSALSSTGFSAGAFADALLIDLGLDEPCQISQRVLPAEITGLR